MSSGSTSFNKGPLLEIIAHGVFTLGDATTVPAGGNKITFNLTKFYATPLCQSIADSLNKDNGKQGCGITTWAADQTIPIDATACAATSPIISSFAKTNYNIYKIVTGNTLFLGEPGAVMNASSEATRPDHFYAKGLLKQN